MFDFLRNMFRPQSYGEGIEQYIISKNPKTVGDVERLTLQYDRDRRFWWPL